MFKSSQDSDKRINPSPQIGVHIDRSPAQLKPASIKHVEEHPSFGNTLLSSHQVASNSTPLSLPSPQSGMQVVGSTAVLQVQ